MRKRKKFHELRYPQKEASKGRTPASQTPALPTSGTEKRETTDIKKYSMIGRGDADQSKHDVEVMRILRMHGANIPDPEDVMEVENRRMSYDGSDTLDDSLIILTDIETGFFRQCVTGGGGGWYGRPNRRHLEKYGLNPHEYNKSAFKEEHIPVAEERERENLVVRLIYRKAYHRSTANITAFGKSVDIFVQECWFKCYLPWHCLPRDIPHSVEVAKNILQDLEPEIIEEAKIVQPKIKAELRRRKASGDYDGDAVLAPAGVPDWAVLPVPKTRDELNGLEALYDEDRAADRRVKEKWDAHFKRPLGSVGSYSLDDLLDREVSFEDMQKRQTSRKW